MAVVSILNQIEDSRKGSKIAKFNGFLEDFLGTDVVLDEEVKTALENVLSAYPDMKILSDYRFNVNKRAISNQIIRYKDVNKLPNNYYDLAYILYGKLQEREIAILIGFGSRDIDYFLAKGMYYCLTEQYGLLEEARQEVLVLTMNHLHQLPALLQELEKLNGRVGAIQRKLDRQVFTSFEQLKTRIMETAQEIKDNILVDVKAVKDRSVVIFRNVATWFLFKKLLYVQYMSNKDLLNKVSEGNIKKHRAKAKELVDEVPYLAYSEMWRVKEAE